MELVHMLKKDWKQKLSDFFAGIGLTDQIIDNMKLLEWLVEDGKARVITCIQQAKDNGVRYSVLEDITEIPRTNLIRILKELKESGIIVQRDVEVTEPRKEKISVYFYNKKKFGFSIENFVNSLMVISRNEITEFKKRM
ncbi:MAG: hypothetical protein HYW24_00580 [Candidatus Aenigmarchaeota archaeon]|nr:hypothetical protein [Candidatus Aenigmarchaeota archaeon]